MNNAASQGHAGAMDVANMIVELWDLIMSFNARGIIQEIFRQHCIRPALGQPPDIAESVEFLASARSRFITAQVIAVDGGIAAYVPTTVQAAELFAAAKA